MMSKDNPLRWFNEPDIKVGKRMSFLGNKDDNLKQIQAINSWAAKILGITTKYHKKG